MKRFEWNKEKNEWLKENRGVYFEEVAELITKGDVLDRLKHPNSQKFPRQFMFVVKLRDYVYFVPFVEDGEKYFLKTIIPSRKANRDYLKK